MNKLAVILSLSLMLMTAYAGAQTIVAVQSIQMPALIIQETNSNDEMTYEVDGQICHMVGESETCKAVK